jgi:heat shock protein HslJ
MRLLAVLALLLALAACGSGTAGTDPSPRGHTYLSDSVTDQGKPRQLVTGTQISLNFTPDNRLIAQAGCNSINAPVDLSGGKVALGETAMTLMGCGPGRSEQDSWLAGVLKAAQWRLDGTTLHVTSGGTEIVLSERKDVPLVGTKWQFDTVATGEVASSLPTGTTVEFDTEVVTFNLGCGKADADYTTTGNRMHIGTVSSTSPQCPGTAEQTILRPLQGVVNYSIEGKRLWLVNTDIGGGRLGAYAAS